MKLATKPVFLRPHNFVIESEEDPEAVRKELLDVLFAYRDGDLEPTVLLEDLSGKQMKFNIRIRQKSSELPEDIKSELLLLLAKHRSSRVKRAA